MSPGFFKKLTDFAKKVGSGVANVAKKVWSVAKPIVGLVAPALQSAPHPLAQKIGTGLTMASPFVDNLLGNR